jgi:hypothetical protein
MEALTECPRCQGATRIRRKATNTACNSPFSLQPEAKTLAPTLWLGSSLVYRRIDVEVYRKSTGRDLLRQ